MRFTMRLMLFILSYLIIPFYVFAQDVQNFNNVEGVYGYLTTDSTDIGLVGDQVISVGSNYARNPLNERGISKETPTYHLVENLTSFNVQTSFTLLPNIQLRLSLPYGFSSGNKTARGLMGQKLNVLDDGSGLNNFNLALKIPIIKIKDRQGFGFALVLPQSIPLKNENKERLQSFYSTSVKLALEYQFNSLKFATNLGYRYRFDSTIGDPRIIHDCSVSMNHICGNPFYLGNAALYSLAISYDISKQMSIMSEIYGRYFYNENNNPMEWLVATRFNNLNGFYMTIGGGQGIGSAISTPSFRFVFSLSYMMNLDKDTDNDGIPDNRDMCKTDKEDIDLYLDSDGCPDNDNDNDNILDISDKCPSQAEDLDGFEDSDGCVDIDNDNDGIIDTRDGCPMQAEDIDKFQDSDGCPDDNELSSSVYMLNGQLFAKGNFYFEQKKSNIVTPQSNEILDNLTDALLKNPKIKKVQIESHVDDSLDEVMAFELTQNRANVVRDMLAQRGVNQDILKPIGYGYSKPIINNNDMSKKRFNNRIVLRVVEMD